MERPKRLAAIMERVRREGTVAVSALSQGLGVSESSVRRDLTMLQAQRLIERTHGNAVYRGAPPDYRMSTRDLDRAERQSRIADIAAKRVNEGSSVGLVSGSITAGIGRVLAERSDLTVVTNAVDIAHQLLVCPHLRVLLTGGLADPETAALSGAFAEAMLGQVNLEVAFVEADGMDARAGLTTDSTPHAQVAATFVRHAHHVIAVLPAARVGRARFTQVCRTDAIHELITDADADETSLAQLAGGGVTVTLA